MPNRVHSSRLIVGVAALLLLGAAGAEELYTLTLRNHRFTPVELEVPAGKKLRLVIRNEDATPEEFESKSLKREKIVKGNSQITLTIGPLDPGSYDFFGEFHEESARGRIVSK